MAFSFGGDKSKSSAYQQQDVYDVQEDALQRMYNMMSQQWQRSLPYINMGMGMMQRAYPGMAYAEKQGRDIGNYLERGGSYGGTRGVRHDLYQSLKDSMQNPSSMGRMYEDIIGGPGNTYVDPLVDSMRTAADERALGMQSRTGMDANRYGQGGSSRHAMQNAMTNRMVDQDLNLAENALREGNYARDMGWKMDIARQADLGRGQAQDRAANILGSADANRQYAMNYLPTHQNLSMGLMAPWMQAQAAPWQMAQMYSNTIGDPTVLTSGTQSGKGGGFGIGF